MDFLRFSGGSRDVRRLLQSSNKKIGNNTTWFKIRKEWNLDTKKRPNYIENTVKIWKDNILPTNLQTLHLKLINNKLLLNNQTKHFINNSQTKEENGRCTFCNITHTTKRGAYPRESLRHFFLECKTSVGIINHCTNIFKISRPNLNKNGELFLYNFNHRDRNENLKINIFFLILKQYLLNCKYGVRLPTNHGAESYIRAQIRLIIICNKKNERLVNEMIPLWTGREIYEQELPGILQDTMGNSVLGKIFLLGNKRHFILQRRANDTFAFPYATNDGYLISLSYCHLNNFKSIM